MCYTFSLKWRHSAVLTSVTFDKSEKLLGALVVFSTYDVQDIIFICFPKIFLQIFLQFLVFVPIPFFFAIFIAFFLLLILLIFLVIHGWLYLVVLKTALSPASKHKAPANHTHRDLHNALNFVNFMGCTDEPLIRQQQ